MNDANAVSGEPIDRKERRFRETRDEILREARRLVERDGAGDLSMRDVAKSTGFTPPALYRYFPGGKEEVLEALATSSLALLGEHFRHISPDLPPEERLLEIAMTYLEFAREHRQELDIMLDSVAALQAPDVEENGLLRPAGVFGLIEEAFAAAAKAGVIKASTPEELTLIFHGAWSLVHGMAILETMHPHHHELFREHARDLVRAYLKGFATAWPESES